MRFVLRQLLELVSEGPPGQAPLKRYRRFASAGACLGIGLTVLFLAAASARAQNEAGPNADLNQDFAGWSFVAGTVLFAGSLYAMTFTGVRALGAITPLGGVAFLVGWASLALAASRVR